MAAKLLGDPPCHTRLPPAIFGDPISMIAFPARHQVCPMREAQRLYARFSIPAGVQHLPILHERETPV
jgi:hypothetical protein